MDFALDILTDSPATVEMVNATKHNFDEDDLVKFQELLLDAEKPLYEGFSNFTKLSAIVKLLNLKGKYGASDKFFTELLGLIKKMQPAEPLVDDLHTLFEIKVDTYDVSTKDNFNLCAIVLWKINDYPALGTLCGCPYSGFKENNVAESLVGTLLHVLGKTKDGVNAQLDLAELGVKPELFAMQEEDKTTLPPVAKKSYCKKLDKMQAEVVVTLCLLEKFFPSLFFDIMIHLTVHLTREVNLCGPICFRWIRNNIVFSDYHKSMETIAIPPDKHETDENEEGKPLLAGKSSEVFTKLFQKSHLRHKQVLKTINPGKRISFLENEHSKSFAKWLRKEVERELAISKERVSETVRWISYGLRATVVKYDAYNINGYTFRTKCHDGKVYKNSGVSVEAIDLHIFKEVATTRQAFYYGVLQEIWVLDYHFRQISLFKCDWVNHRAGGVKRDTLGYTLVDLNNLGHKTPPKNYKDMYDEVDEEFSTVIHQRNDNILPRVNQHDLEIIVVNLDSSSDNNNSDLYNTSQISTSREIDYDSLELPKSLLKWYRYLSDEYKDNGRF
uniref:DUF4218 domain-containing protein n=1 Tax=Tanacetum cinerariifolium TaxID=118510 RepID=A0A6L2J7M0_TANCI|nr:hypothetical protein [Tanacetum cinerariifolium]